MASERSVDKNDQSFRIDHGRLTVNIPYRMFKGRTATLDDNEVSKFRGLLSSRYPWLTENALDVIVENARNERETQIFREWTSASKARVFIESGDLERALRILDDHLELYPEDAEALYAKGEALCRIGRIEEGYHCISKARRITIG